MRRNSAKLNFGSTGASSPWKTCQPWLPRSASCTLSLKRQAEALSKSSTAHTQARWCQT